MIVSDNEDEEEEEVPVKRKKAKRAVVDSDDENFEADEEAAAGPSKGKRSLYDDLVSRSASQSPQRSRAADKPSVRRVNIDTFRHSKDGPADEEPVEQDPIEAREKEARRQDFVRKFDLHVAEEMTAQKRRRGLDGEEDTGEGDDEEPEEEEEPKAKKQKTAAKSGKAGGGTKFTPLEQQFLELRKKHPGVLLVIEVGYKCRFFEEDARVG
jgi:DNA mismatch repair protein MSH3